MKKDYFDYLCPGTGKAVCVCLRPTDRYIELMMIKIFKESRKFDRKKVRKEAKSMKV